MISGSANYDSVVGDVTAVGAYTAKPSHGAYGTFDQGGNVYEWCEHSDTHVALHYGLGGSFNCPCFELSTSHSVIWDGIAEREILGFRVASPMDDLFISGVEPIQVVWGASAYVVGKKTAVKATVMSTLADTVKVPLKVVHNHGQDTYVEYGPEGDGVSIEPGSNWIFVPGGPSSSHSQPWNIGDELMWTSEGTDTGLSVEVDPFDTITEADEQNNSFTCGPLTFHESKALKVRYYLITPFCPFWSTDYGTPPRNAYWQTTTKGTAFMEAVFPIKRGGIIYSQNGTLYGNCIPRLGLWVDLWNIELSGSLAGVDRAVGIATPAYFSCHGLELDGQPAAGATHPWTTASLVSVGYWTTPAHEMHHNLPHWDDWRQGEAEEYLHATPGYGAQGFRS